MEDREKIIARIQALQAKTIENGCSEAEALTAAGMVKDLLDKHQMQMSDVELLKSEGECVEGEFNLETTQRHPLEWIMPCIAQYAGVKSWIYKTPIRNRARTTYHQSIAYFGLPSDVEVAKAITTIIRDALLCETKQFQLSNLYLDNRDRGDKRVATRSFQNGMARRIGDQLISMHVAAHPPETSNGTALMVLKDQVIKRDFDKRGMTLGSSKLPDQDVDVTAYMTGQKAGERLNLQSMIN